MARVPYPVPGDVREAILQGVEGGCVAHLATLQTPDARFSMRALTWWMLVSPMAHEHVSAKLVAMGYDTTETTENNDVSSLILLIWVECCRNATATFPQFSSPVLSPEQRQSLLRMGTGGDPKETKET